MATRPSTWSDDLIEVVKVLLLIQAAILVASTIEAALWSTFFGPGGSGIAASALAALIAFVASTAVGHGRRWGLRLVYGLEAAVILVAAIDLALSLLLAGSSLPLVAMLTRLALPIAVIAMLRHSTPTPDLAAAR